MDYFLNSTISSGVSLDLETSWAAKSLKDALNQSKYDARFQQKQIQEKEEKLLKLLEARQQKTMEKVNGRSNGSGGTSPVSTGKVRQMFDERRQKAGFDKSYPLEPIKNAKMNSLSINRVPNLEKTSSNPLTSRTVKSTSTFKASVQRSITQSRNGKPPVTHMIRQSGEANFINGDLKSKHLTYEENGTDMKPRIHTLSFEANGNNYENDDVVDSMNKQQRQLELMMESHNLNDSIYGEPNGNKKETRNEINGYIRKPLESPSRSVKNAPLKPSYGSVKDRPVARKTTPKQTPTERPTPLKLTSRPSSTENQSPNSTPEKKTKMKSSLHTKARSMGTNRGVASPTARMSISQSGAPVNRDDLKACQFCNRRFAPDRIQLHEDICARTVKKKRKVYDTVKHRVQGTEAETFVRKGAKVVAKGKVHPGTKTDWRRQHEDFISTIRAAKQAQAHVAAGGKLSDLPPPPPSYNPDYVQCPHCGRRFNETAAARHIPKCATMLHNKPNRLGPQPNKRF